jgi:hypothetical protein
MVSVRRFHMVARNGISDFRAALAEVYAGEIEEFERGRMALGRLMRFVGRQSKAAWIVIRRNARRKEPAQQAVAPEAEAGSAGPPDASS